MQQIIITIPAIALMLLSAHALRQGDFGLTAAFAVLVGLAFTHKAWVRLVMIVSLLWGGYLWAHATVDFVLFRQVTGLPWVRLAWIMGGVILFNLLGLWILLNRSADGFFHKDEKGSVARAAIFVLTVFGLAMARNHVTFPILLADRYFPGWGWLEMALLGLYAQWIGGLMLSPKGHRTIRPRIWAMFSFIFFAQLLLGVLGADRMLMTGELHLPVPALIAAGPVFRGSGFFMVILFAVTLLLVGPAWCSHLCYIGAWDDVMSRRGARPAPRNRLARFSVYGRGLTLALVLGAAMTFRFMGVPGATAVLFAAAFGLVGVGIMVLVSRKSGMMMHCTAYCPMGLLANVLGKLSPWRVRIEADCDGCGACFTRCRYNSLDGYSVGRGKPAISCTLCGECMSACAHRRIGYRFPGLRPERARAIFIVMVSSLHAIFLGVARI